MLLRLWRGWTNTPSATQRYQQLLLDEIAPAILGREIPGLSDLTVWRRNDSEVPDSRVAEFLTSMSFDDRHGIAAFTGGDPGRSVVPPAARQLLAGWDEHSQHYTRLASYRAQQG